MKLLFTINSVASSHEDVYKESLNGLGKTIVQGVSTIVQESANVLSKIDEGLKEFNKELESKLEEQKIEDNKLRCEYLPKVRIIKSELTEFYSNLPDEYKLYREHCLFDGKCKNPISFLDDFEQEKGYSLKILYDTSFKLLKSEKGLLKIFSKTVSDLYTENVNIYLNLPPESTFKKGILYLLSIISEENKQNILNSIEESLKFNLYLPQEIKSKNILVNKNISFKYHPAAKEELKQLVTDEKIYLGDIETSHITDMSGLFGCSKRTDFSGIEKWDVSNVTNMSQMFFGASQFNSNLSQWDVSNVTNMSQMFCGAEEFNSDLSCWNVSNVTNMSGMFRSDPILRFLCWYKNQKMIPKPSILDVSKETSMKKKVTFFFSKFNSDISKWNVSNVTDMSWMFYGASQFNSDLSRWNVSNVTNMRYMFMESLQFNSDLSRWNVSNVTDMGWMFYRASQFNSDLSQWDISNVTNLHFMFYGALNFYSDLNSWKVSAVSDMDYMFDNVGIMKSFLPLWYKNRASR